MNTKKSLSLVFVLVLVVGVISVINHAYGNWEAPTNVFPNCDASVPACNTPLNIGATDQVKPAGLSVNAFTAYMGSTFHQDVTVTELSESSPDRSVCADTSGKLELCNPPGSVNIAAGDSTTIFVTDIPGFSQPAPIDSWGGYSGTHTAFTGSVQVQPTWENNSLPSTGVDLELLKNSQVISCVNLNNSDYAYYNDGKQRTVSFAPPTAFSLTDSIVVEVERSGSCTPNN